MVITRDELIENVARLVAMQRMLAADLTEAGEQEYPTDVVAEILDALGVDCVSFERMLTSVIVMLNAAAPTLMRPAIARALDLEGVAWVEANKERGGVTVIDNEAVLAPSTMTRQ